MPYFAESKRCHLISVSAHEAAIVDAVAMQTLLWGIRQAH
jgi:hypothetical protein